MKIGIIVSSQEAMKQAGVRIRYRRIEKHVAAFGHSLTLHTIDSLSKSLIAREDFWVFSKCYDSRAVLLAEAMRQSGKQVGADFFDDIFSQHNDNRMTRARAWLRDMLPLLNFGMCSTPRMAQVLSSLLPNIPIHILNDPMDRINTGHVGHGVREKLALAWETKRLSVAWFGVGDNPRFPVGLSDLFSFGSSLRELEKTGFSVDLTILTNERALTRDGLELLSRLPVSHRLDLWSERAERLLLDNSLIAFLPVNAQNFSTVKSLNRAVSSLSHGCQILSVGHDLYHPLKDFLYRSPKDLLADLQNGRLKVRPETLRELTNLLRQWSDASVETAELLDFLSELPWTPPSAARTLAVINGRSSPGRTHKLAQNLDFFSIALPFTEAKMNYDLLVDQTVGSQHLELRLTANAANSLSDAFAACIGPSSDSSALKKLIVKAPRAMVARTKAAQTESIAAITTLYDQVVRDTADMTAVLFPVDHIVLSETTDPLDSSPIDPAAIVLEPVDISLLERILIVANGQMPSLDIFFQRPLEPLVSAVQVRTAIMDDRNLRASLGREWAKKKRWDEIQSRLDLFKPTVIVFCRYSGPLAARYMAYAKDNGIATVFQIDDDLFNIPPSIGEEKYLFHTDPVRMDAIRMLMSQSDLVYTSTQTLASSLASLEIAKEIWAGEISAAGEVRRVPVEGKAVEKIGFMGGGDHARDLEEIAPAIATILDRHDHVRFELFSSIALPGELERFGDRITRIDPVSSYAAFYRIFYDLDWDIGLCPLERTKFNRSKAVLKWVEYTSAGMATVATAGTAYDECSSDGCGMLADNLEEWVDMMDRLITQPGLCFAQVMRAQDRLKDRYSPKAMLDQTKAVLESVLGRPLIKTAAVFA